MSTEDKKSVSAEEWDKAFGVLSPINEDITLGELIKAAKYKHEGFSIEITPDYYHFEIKEKYGEIK